ncbi:MAG: hypothetical protein WAN71_08320, partial [Mycobacterium sp.]
RMNRILGYWIRSGIVGQQHNAVGLEVVECSNRFRDIAKEIGGDAVDLLELFELHARALYDTALRLISEGTSQ